MTNTLTSVPSFPLTQMRTHTLVSTLSLSEPRFLLHKCACARYRFHPLSNLSLYVTSAMKCRRVTLPPPHRTILPPPAPSSTTMMLRLLLGLLVTARVAKCQGQFAQIGTDGQICNPDASTVLGGCESGCSFAACSNACLKRPNCNFFYYVAGGSDVGRCKELADCATLSYTGLHQNYQIWTTLQSPPPHPTQAHHSWLMWLALLWRTAHIGQINALAYPPPRCSS